MTEPIEKITDETVIGEINTDDYATSGCGCGCVPRDIILRAKGLDEPYRTTLLTSAEKDARIQDYKALFEQQVMITDRLIKVLGFYASEETYIYAECKDMGYEARKILSGQ